jgi:hypothetical protein
LGGGENGAASCTTASAALSKSGLPDDCATFTSWSAPESVMVSSSVAASEALLSACDGGR